MSMRKVIRLSLAVVISAFSFLFFESAALAAVVSVDAVSAQSADIYDMVMLSKINSYREANGVPALEYNEDLIDVANYRIGELVVNFDHTRPNGESYKTVYAELGLTDKYERGSENIAKILADWDFENENGDEYVDYIFEAYKNSDRHNENMLKPYWKYYGGSFLTNYNGSCYQIQVFAK